MQIKCIWYHEFFLTVSRIQRILKLRISNWLGHNNLAIFQKILLCQIKDHSRFCSFFSKNITGEKRVLRVQVLCSIWCKILWKRIKYTWAKVYFDFLLSKRFLFDATIESFDHSSKKKELEVAVTFVTFGQNYDKNFRHIRLCLEWRNCFEFWF